MRLSISNLGWRETAVGEIAPALRAAGLDGVEIAPTAVWPDAPNVGAARVREFAQLWRDQGLAVSGIQSLLFGHPEFQVFDRARWPATLEHLRAMITIAGLLEAGVVVFGSPRNRVKGDLASEAAHSIATDFFGRLVPVLEANNTVLTLEPNAPEYGADYLTHYADVVVLADRIDSRWIQPQIDTGCLAMVGDDPAKAADRRLPKHVHASAPHLVAPPAGVDHGSLAESLTRHGYDGWVVLEMLPAEPDPTAAAVAAAVWLASTYRQES